MAVYQPMSPMKAPSNDYIAKVFDVINIEKKTTFKRATLRDRSTNASKNDGPVDSNSKVGQLLTSMRDKNLPVYRGARFRPVNNWRSYYDSLLRSELLKCDPLPSHIEERLARIKADHEEWELNNPKVVVVKQDPLKDVQRELNPVIASLKVLASGKVKLCMVVNPMQIIYEKYYNKGVLPPVDEHIKMLKKVGYPDSHLEKVLKKALEADKKKAEMEVVIERVFGKYSTKPSKPKAKTLMSNMKKKLF